MVGITFKQILKHIKIMRVPARSLPRVLGDGRLGRRGIRRIGLLLHGQRIEEVEVDVDGFIV